VDKELFVYLNGRLIPKSEAKISVFDHGLLYGDGVFEGIRAYDGVVFQLKEHIDRLFESSNYIELKLPLEKRQLIDAVLATLRKNNLKNAYIRLVVTRGVGDLGVNPVLCKDGTLIIITEPIEISAVPKEPRVVSTIITTVRRDGIDATTHEVKSLNYLNSILAVLEANRAGVDYPIILDSRGYISESSTMNVFMVKKGVIITPSTSAAILHGITRARLIRLCKDMGYTTIEKDITPFELISADEVFFSGTLAEIIAVGSINNKPIGSGSVGLMTKEIFREFNRVVRSSEEGTQIFVHEKLAH
jgi:branched-chain amino acid aminotransferase